MLGFEILIKAQLEMAQFNREQAELMQRMIKTNNEYLKTKMKTEHWIKRSEREIGAQDFPVMLGCYTGSVWNKTVSNNLEPISDGWTHWYPLGRVPEPPQKEPTQEELDAKEFIWWFQNTLDDRGPAPTFTAGLKCERTHVRTLLQRFDNHQMNEKELIAMIRGRVK